MKKKTPAAAEPGGRGRLGPRRQSFTAEANGDQPEGPGCSLAKGEEKRSPSSQAIRWCAEGANWTPGTSQPGKNKRVAVKVIDMRGNEAISGNALGEQGQP